MNLERHSHIWNWEISKCLIVDHKLQAFSVCEKALSSSEQAIIIKPDIQEGNWRAWERTCTYHPVPISVIWNSTRVAWKSSSGLQRQAFSGSAGPMHCLSLLNQVQGNNEKSYRSTLYEYMERHYVGWSRAQATLEGLKWLRGFPIQPVWLAFQWSFKTSRQNEDGCDRFLQTRKQCNI